MSIAKYFVDFIFYSFCGWIFESIYCTINQKEWQDRGFLFGPICPIYGSCVVAAEILFTFIPQLSSPDLPWWEVFLICMVGSAIAEYGTSFVLEKRFHARWWDYSDMPLNLNGRICLPASTGFGAAGVVLVKYVLPFMESAQGNLNIFAYETMSIIMALLLGADFALTEASLSSLLHTIEDYKEEMNIRAEITYENIVAAPKKFQEGVAEAPEKIKETLTEGLPELSLMQREGKLSPLKWSENVVAQTKEKISEKYVNGMDFHQRRIFGSIKKFTPISKNREIDDTTSMEHLRNALRMRKKKNKDNEKAS